MPDPDYKIHIRLFEDHLFYYHYEGTTTAADHHHQSKSNTVGWKCTPAGPHGDFKIVFASAADSPFDWTEKTINTNGPWQAWPIKAGATPGRDYKYSVIVGDAQDDPYILIDSDFRKKLNVLLIATGVAMIAVGICNLLKSKRSSRSIQERS
jgi:hypothetical protein